MRKPLLPLALASAFAIAIAQTPVAAPKLNIIVFGAHPDDAEYRGAGVAMKWAKLGHHVKFVSATRHRPLADGRWSARPPPKE